MLSGGGGFVFVFVFALFALQVHLLDTNVLLHKLGVVKVRMIVL